jgi:predicted nucleic-acid-binding protein
MRAVDTNVVVRLLAADHPAQFAVARRFFETESVYISVSVMIETEWVLRRAMRIPSPEVSRLLTRLAGVPTVTIEDAAEVRLALDWAAAGFDFADALHLSRARDCDDLVTFDQDFIRAAAKVNTIPVGFP